MRNRDAYASPRIKELLQAANDAARLFRTAFLALAILTLYVLITALSANDEVLFKNGYLQASPVLNVRVQASAYFIAIPWILLLVHFNFLILGVFLARKVEDYRQALPPSQGISKNREMLRLLFPIPLTQVVLGQSSLGALHRLLKGSIFLSLILLPLFTLGTVEAQFLDFQERWITWMHSGVLVLDFLLISYLWPGVERLYGRKTDQRLRLSVLLAGTVVASFLAVAHLLPYSHPLHHLDVQNKRLYLHSEEIQPAAACADATLALNLSRRSFRYARMSKAIMCNAVLRNARLEYAEMSNAELQRVDMTHAWLQHANLSGAQLQAADLQDAKLHDANLRSAQLQGARLNNAVLYNATLRNAQLQAADLGAARLQAADLREAQFQGTDLWAAFLHGAEVWEAEFQGANLQETQFQGVQSTGSYIEFLRMALTAIGAVAGVAPPDLDRSFGEIMEERAGKKSDLTTTIVFGGLSQGRVDAAAQSMASYVRSADVEEFRRTMAAHVGKKKTRGSVDEVEKRGARGGVYSEDDVQRWVRAYERHCCEVLQRQLAFP